MIQTSVFKLADLSHFTLNVIRITYVAPIKRENRIKILVIEVFLRVLHAITGVVSFLSVGTIVLSSSVGLNVRMHASTLGHRIAFDVDALVHLTRALVLLGFSGIC